MNMSNHEVNNKTRRHELERNKKLYPHCEPHKYENAGRRGNDDRYKDHRKGADKARW